MKTPENTRTSRRAPSHFLCPKKMAAPWTLPTLERAVCMFDITVSTRRVPHSAEKTKVRGSEQVAAPLWFSDLLLFGCSRRGYPVGLLSKK